MESNNRYHSAARAQLEVLRQERARALRQERYYITLAAGYGVSMSEIVHSSGVSLDRVRAILSNT